MNGLSVVAGRAPVRPKGVLVLDEALRYAARGWPVLPCESRDKAPLTMGGVKGATTDSTAIRKWWRGWPNANIGIATGSASGLLVVDIDPHNGGKVSLAELEARYGPLPRDYVVETGGGGQHIYLAFPEGAKLRCGKLAPGIDIKGDGGYVIAPPSIHPSGAPYRSERDGDVPQAPDWLIHAIEGPPKAAQAHPPERLPVSVDNLFVSDRMKCLIHEGKPKGQRSEAVFGVIRAMLKVGHSDEEITAVLMDPANALSEKPREKGPAWLHGELGRAREKPDRDAEGPARGDGVSGLGPVNSGACGSTLPAGGGGARVKTADGPKREQSNASANGASISYRRVSDIEAKPIRWLWHGRIARGKVSMLAGDPGLGKSQVAVSMAAVISRAGTWPDGMHCERGNVIFLSAEDDPADTLRPRLEAAEADLSRLFVLDAVIEAHHGAKAKRGIQPEDRSCSVGGNARRDRRCRPHRC